MTKNLRSFFTARKAKEYFVIFLLATLGYFIRRVIWEHYTEAQHLIVYAASIFNIVFIWEGFRGVNRLLNHYLPYENQLIRRIVVQLVLGLVLLLFLRYIIFTVVDWVGVNQEMNGLFRASTVIIFVLLSIGVNLVFFASYFLEQWKESIKQSERLEREKTQVQFDNLKNQLNPHFLFNALTSLNSLIFDNQQLASDFLQNLSKVYRYVLQHKDKGQVSVQTELDFIVHFIFLLETRYAEGIRFKMDVGEEARDKGIVPVTLQILVENAVKHNQVDVAKPLEIEVKSIGDYLVVSNTLRPRKLVEGSNRQGLENLKNLYRFLTERPVLIEHSDTHFMVKIPLLEA
ncbi:histidine kinase [Cytophagales bacterium LB-30]|uniref:Histidine kinase n=1 Tax=Shiella aurantiaca TaxID=3058365 RepID=A0ABT8F347_9BACT|nr:histidine kinase [Shiella aurantiaca]MDN4164664.1 histidine kinase [Shiella aurantiaca]